MPITVSEGLKLSLDYSRWRTLWLKEHQALLIEFPKASIELSKDCKHAAITPMHLILGPLGKPPTRAPVFLAPFFPLIMEWTPLRWLYSPCNVAALNGKF